MPRRSSFRIIRVFLISFLASFFLFLSSASARTWRVSKGEQGDFQLVQAGIDAAQAGDSVIVGPGRYLENIRFKGRDIVLKSLEGPEVTILDGSSQNRSVVEFLSGESNACVIRGFTITGGRGSAVLVGDKIGGGIVVDESEPSIIDNISENNSAFSSPTTGVGGGIFCRAGFPDSSRPLRTPRILGNVIRSNSAGGNAGGIGLQEKISAVISGNTISGNTTADGDGAGVWILARQNNETIVENNLISSNEAMDHGGGILIGNLFHGAAAPILMKIEGNVISGNIARGSAGNGASGGGMLLSCIGGSVALNTVVGNQGLGSGKGGGIVLSEPSSPLVERNVIALNSGGGGILCQQSSTPQIQDNLVWGNDGGDALGICTSWVGTNGNIQADPLFCGAANNDFSLPENSPAMTHPAGPLGAITLPGCQEGVVIESTTWGRIKARWVSSKAGGP